MCDKCVSPGNKQRRLGSESEKNKNNYGSDDVGFEIGNFETKMTLR